MHIKQFIVNHFEENCYLVSDDDTKECAIIDPGMTQEFERIRTDNYIKENNLKVVMVLLTHAHTDHVASLEYICNKYNVPVTMNLDGKQTLKLAAASGTMMGFNIAPIENVEIKPVKDGEFITLGKHKIECRDVSGHCPGSMAYILHDDRMVITGDALFRGSIGRTDFPGGDYDLLIKNIREKLLVLDDDYSVLPGHGDCSTIGDERNNPFIFDF